LWKSQTPNPKPQIPIGISLGFGIWVFGTWVFLEGQPETELRRPHLRGRVLQELRGRALLRTDAPVRTVEHVEHVREQIERSTAAERDPLLDAEVGPVLRRREQIVARNDRAIRTQALAEVRAGATHIATVGVRQADPCGEEMQRAQLEAMAHLPDAVQYHPVT